jgi:2-polyprenyl-3-methyl-5-hydroxy-6-metoxy-1,4-benzoquinol methylase
MENLRGRVVVDFGAGAGAFLDTVAGMAAATIAIEPSRAFRDEIHRKGHVVFESGSQVSSEWLGRADLAVCFSVVEHVEDPAGLLREIRATLKPGGRALVSTPNRCDWLMDLLPDCYPAFFYRQVHRWYFDAGSLVRLGESAGFARVEPFFVHRFDLSNFLVWLRDRRPSGLGHLEIPGPLSAAFVATLEASGRADYLYAWLEN